MKYRLQGFLPLPFLNDIMTIAAPLYVPPLVVRAFRSALILLFLGLLIFVAVDQVSNRCETKKDYLATEQGDRILTDTENPILLKKWLQCYVGGHEINFPDWQQLYRRID